MESYRSLLVGIDFNRCSAVALNQALRLATGFRAEVRALHVIDTLVAVDLEESLSELQRNICEVLLTDARQAWTEFASAIPGAPAIDFEVQINNRIVGILQHARSRRADLLVLGAFGLTPPDVGFGTVATSCVRSSTTDVLLIRDTQPGPHKVIVAGVDFSEASARALARAAQLAQLDCAALHVLHVSEPPWLGLDYRAPAAVPTDGARRQYADDLSRRLAKFARSTLSAYPSLNYRCEVFDHGSHRSGIVSYAQQTNADLIVVGTRGRANIHDVLLGTTAEKALKHSTCSVLAVKPVAPAAHASVMGVGMT